MRGAVGAVLADGVLLVQLVGQGVHVSLRRQRLEKRRIEHGNHRRARHVLEARVDAHERRLVVQRRELRQLVDLLDDVVVDKHRAIEVLASLHDAMAYRIDFLERVDGLRRPARQRFEDERHRIVMIGHLGIDDLFVLIEAVLMERLGRTYPLADALRKQLLLLHVDQLVLQGR